MVFKGLSKIDSGQAYAILKVFGSEGGSDAYQVGLGLFHIGFGFAVLTLPSAFHLLNCL